MELDRLYTRPTCSPTDIPDSLLRVGDDQSRPSPAHELCDIIIPAKFGEAQCGLRHFHSVCMCDTNRKLYQTLLTKHSDWN